MVWLNLSKLSFLIAVHLVGLSCSLRLSGGDLLIAHIEHVVVCLMVGGIISHYIHGRLVW